MPSEQEQQPDITSPEPKAPPAEDTQFLEKQSEPDAGGAEPKAPLSETEKFLQERFQGDHDKLVKSYQEAERKLTSMGQENATLRQLVGPQGTPRMQSTQSDPAREFDDKLKGLYKKEQELRFNEDLEGAAEVRQAIDEMRQEKFRMGLEQNLTQKQSMRDAQMEQQEFLHAWTRTFFERNKDLDSEEFGPVISLAEKMTADKLEREALREGKDPRTAYTYRDLMGRQDEVAELARELLGKINTSWSNRKPVPTGKVKPPADGSGSTARQRGSNNSKTPVEMDIDSMYGED